jgi:hypothetical protein
MPYNSFNQRHFSEREKAEIRQKIDELFALLEPKCANLSPEERQRLGSIHERNKLFVNKVLDYHQDTPDKSSPDVDWEEFHNDYLSRVFLEAIINRIRELLDGLISAKVLHDYDNYHAALTDYDYAKYKARTNATLFRNKLDELAQFFVRSAQAEDEKTGPPTTD